MMRPLLVPIAIALSVMGCRSERAVSRQKPPAKQTAASVTALARRTCEALHVLPGRRVGECCGRPAPHYLFDECVRVLGAALQKESVALDPRAVTRCRESVAQSFAGCDWVTPSQPLPPAACQGLVKGRVTEGGPCRSSLECVAPLHCSERAAGEPGRCRAPQAIGAPCASGADPLAAYLLERDVPRSHPLCADFCSALSQRCEALPAVASACVASIHCVPGQRCVDGRCAIAPKPARAQAGASCASDLDCDTGGCAREGDGQQSCGMKCSASVAGLDPKGQKLALPARPRR